MLPIYVHLELERWRGIILIYYTDSFIFVKKMGGGAGLNLRSPLRTPDLSPTEPTPWTQTPSSDRREKPK